jgi:sigma-B regulation protein RsbU (phosphoserine phosphatase)
MIVMPTRILVVDDEPDLEPLMRQKFRRHIRDGQYEFLFARNGFEALQQLENASDVNIVLSDINMPEMDGLTLLTKLGELEKPTMKAVIVSAYGDMENIRTAMNRGAFDFLTKPIDFNDLEITIDKTSKQIEIVRNAVVEHEQLVAVQRDLTVASRIQQSILPRKFPAFPDRKEFDIFADMIPAREVGGDFYDFFFLDSDRLAFVIGDVSGKGVPAAILMAVSRTLLKAIASQVVNPGECLRRLNTMLIPETETAMFVTIFYGVLNTRTGEIQYANGGHNSPYVLQPSGTVRVLESPGGILVGMLPDLEYDVLKLRLEPGDTLYMFTDGVTEAMDAGQELFGEERLVESLKKVGNSGLQDLTKVVAEDIKGYVNGVAQSDDITMLAVRYLGK